MVQRGNFKERRFELFNFFKNKKSEPRSLFLLERFKLLTIDIFTSVLEWDKNTLGHQKEELIDALNCSLTTQTYRRPKSTSQTFTICARRCLKPLGLRNVYSVNHSPQRTTTISRLVDIARPSHRSIPPVAVCGLRVFTWWQRGGHVVALTQDMHDRCCLSYVRISTITVLSTLEKPGYCHTTSAFIF